VEIFPGFPAAEVLYNDDGSVRGVATGNMGVGKDGEPTENFQLGMELHAKYTVFAEGSRGHLGRQLIARYKLDEGRDPQSYGIGVKECGRSTPSATSPAWCCTRRLADGERHLRRLFLYHMEDNKVTIGFVVGLDYSNPYLSPFEEFQRWKTHPNIRWYLRRGQGHQAGQAPRLRRARHHGGRPAVAAQDGVPGRRAGGLRRRLPEREPHQGQPRRDQDRHAGAEAASTRCRPAASTTNSPPTRRPSRRAGCTPS
jgi:flavin-dependent dehydrogenase